MAEIKDIFSKIEDLLKELNCEFDTDWDYLKDITGSVDDNVKIIVKNPHIDREISITVTGYNSFTEFNFAYFRRSLGFDHISEMLDLIRGFLTSETGCSGICLGKKHKLSHIGGVYREHLDTMPPLECLYTGPKTNYGGDMPKQVRGQCLRYGAELRFIFWDPQYDRTIFIEKESKS